MTKEFQWTDELVKEFAILNKDIWDDITENRIQAFKEFKKPKQNSPHNDWEILSLIGMDGSIIYKKSYTFPECFQSLVNAKDVFTIHSIKRLSDGKVFTIGDKVLHTNDVMNRNGVIESFRILGVDVLLVETNNYDVPLCYIIPSPKPKPLFTTADGVKIYDRDIYFDVWDFKIRENIAKEEHRLALAHDSMHDFLRFSTQEAAQQYVLENKPCLSANDIINIFCDYHWFTAIHIKKIKQKAKEKFNF